MKQLPSRLRRLDEALAALPLEEPMLLSELDGFLTGILVCPEPIMSGEWCSMSGAPTRPASRPSTTRPTCSGSRTR